MIEIKVQHPYIDETGKVYEKLIKHYAEDENGVRYMIKQLQTKNVYDEAIDVFPCKYSYTVTNIKIEEAQE